MQGKLLAGTELKCPTCMELLEQCNFNPEDLQTVVDAFLAGTFNESNMFPVSAAPSLDASQESQNDEVSQNPAVAKPSRAAAVAWLHTLSPMMTLLEPGTHGKKYPIRCNWCKTKKFKEGKVLELAFMREPVVKHFVLQHCRSVRHQRRKEAEQGSADNVIQIVRAPCQGLCVADEQARKLHLNQADFNLWAEHSNFDGCAKHKYFRDPNNGAWTVRSYECLQVSPQRAGFDRVVCTKCHELGSPSAVTWSVLFFVKGLPGFAFL